VATSVAPSRSAAAIIEASTVPSGRSSAINARVERPAIAPLDPNERRLVQVITRPDGVQNEIYLIHRREIDSEKSAGEPVNYVAIVERSDAPADRVPPAWYEASEVEGIYRKLAFGLRTSPPPAGFQVWTAPEIEWLARNDSELGPLG